MEKIKDHSDIISLWPTVGRFAYEIGQKETTCRGWKLRKSIPVKYWDTIIQAAKNYDFKNHVTFATLVESISHITVVKK